jgi:hypothetical protein
MTFSSAVAGSDLYKKEDYNLPILCGQIKDIPLKHAAKPQQKQTENLAISISLGLASLR